MLGAREGHGALRTAIGADTEAMALGVGTAQDDALDPSVMTEVVQFVGDIEVTRVAHDTGQPQHGFLLPFRGSQVRILPGAPSLQPKKSMISRGLGQCYARNTVLYRPISSRIISFLMWD